MVHIRQFTFGPFQENTFLLYANNKDCWIIDPGCYYPEEEAQLKLFIENQALNPVKLLNTHCHLDHVAGNAFINQKYGLFPEYDKRDMRTMDMAPKSAQLYGIMGFKTSPACVNFISEYDELTLGEMSFEIRFCPGHAPGHLVFIQHEQKLVIGGDVLFQGSIGRTDLPGGDYDTLLTSIKTQLYTLPDDYVVYPGHGPSTTIGAEKRSNPFVRST
jgi:glyoxylase-like metal-dependent hydrolase (beta-lactamase superfamily II)